MIPDYQTLMRPVLECARAGEVKVSDVVEKLAQQFELTEDERKEMLPSGKQARFTNRINWARSYLKQAGLVENTRRSFFSITSQGLQVLDNYDGEIDAKYLEKFPSFMEFRGRSKARASDPIEENQSDDDRTPDEVMRRAYEAINELVASDLLGGLRNSSPEFFEGVIVELLVRMGYGAADDSGNVIGGAGDDGVDGVIDQDPLGVDQVYIQAKRYRAENKIGAGPIRDFYGALGLKDVSKGIFVTTSSFTSAARETAAKLGARIVLIDGVRLAHLMIKHEVGVRVSEVFKISTLEDGYFD